MSEVRKIPTATVPMPQRQETPQPRQPQPREPQLHPAIVESAALFTNLYEDNEYLKAEANHLKSALQRMSDELADVRRQLSYERNLREDTERSYSMQAKELDTVVRVVMAARDRAMQRNER